MIAYRQWMWRASLAFLIAGFASAGVVLAQSETSKKAVPPTISKELRDGVRLEAAGKPIDTAVGHAAPLLVDFDGDGKLDLLVGQFGEGRLWIYKNEGTNQSPRYAKGSLFQAGGKEGKVPTG